MKTNKTRKAVVFPRNRKVLNILGENIKLARKRRNLTQTLIAERTGLSRLTVRKVEIGDPSVSIGHYVN
ncbi:MAG: helix-turn-helix transcriptional regulator, partial [Bacteroidetes bacterium]|nr:helix-turn-helix transcriptional regulator [Bacteroidota bacterium]